MSIFKTKAEKEADMMLLIKRTQSVMQKQIKLLNAQKKVFFEQAAAAKEAGNEDLLCSALAAYRQADTKLNHALKTMAEFDLAAQIKESADATAEFAKTMAVISREMVSLTDEKSYAEIEQGFKKSMENAKIQSAHLEKIMAMGRQIWNAPLAEEKEEPIKTEEPSANTVKCEGDKEPEQPPTEE